METKDCKDFILSVADTYILNKKDIWKRTRKYKENTLILRDFLSSSGDQITIYETDSGLLGVYSMELNTNELSEKALQFLSKKTFVKKLEKFIEDNFCSNSRVLDDDYLSRRMSYDTDLINHLVEENLIKDIDFDLENTEITVIDIDGAFVLLLEAGGDWEQGVSAYFYWSKKHNMIKGFFPIGEGNTYNMETNTAYGSEYCNNPKLRERYEEEGQKLDYKKANSIGIEQLRQHIERDYKSI